MPMPEDVAFGLVYQRVMGRWIAAGEASKLSEDEQDFIAIATLLNEHANGSFSQYLENSYADMAGRAMRALERIGCVEARVCLEEAMSVFEGGASADQQRRGEQLEALSEAGVERLSELSQRLECEAEGVWQALMRHAGQWTV